MSNDIFDKAFDTMRKYGSRCKSFDKSSSFNLFSMQKHGAGAAIINANVEYSTDANFIHQSAAIKVIIDDLIAMVSKKHGLKLNVRDASFDTDITRVSRTLHFYVRFMLVNPKITAASDSSTKTMDSPLVVANDLQEKKLHLFNCVPFNDLVQVEVHDAAAVEASALLTLQQTSATSALVIDTGCVWCEKSRFTGLFKVHAERTSIDVDYVEVDDSTAIEAVQPLIENHLSNGDFPELIIIVDVSGNNNKHKSILAHIHGSLLQYIGEANMRGFDISAIMFRTSKAFSSDVEIIASQEKLSVDNLVISKLRPDFEARLV